MSDCEDKQAAVDVSYEDEVEEGWRGSEKVEEG